MNKIEADLTQLKVRGFIETLDYDTLELFLIEVNRKIKDDFQKNKMAGGEVSAEDARLFK